MDSLDRETEYVEKLNELVEKVNELTAITIKQNTVIRYLCSKKFRYKKILEIPKVKVEKLSTLEVIPIPQEEDDDSN